MAQEPVFKNYSESDFSQCMRLFEANCPEFFAANERVDYQQFLLKNPDGYQLLEFNSQLVGAFGVNKIDSDARLHWIMLQPNCHGLGLGAAMMHRALYLANLFDVRSLKIAASHKSAAFFAQFGAKSLHTILDGWGPDMHRVDMIIEL